MDENTRRYGRSSTREEQPIELNEILIPDDDSFDGEQGYEPFESAAEDGFYDEPYEEAYADEHEGRGLTGHFRVAMNVFDTISILVGALVILVLATLLLSLLNWLQADILHSVVLLQSGLQ